mmetsp:Transcript_33236/g.54867  ORF Transcript_33236/g.54867 Transcript_33236/m.54867 type:complete len:125 (+) Transcript_33236:264-638(+)|eukprot:CAMPEP_0119031070 /NCGR_PEP_ID=MMETSP1176-20130426/41356_1 /TAXON_ID=265551 /ORGANISM="Synedropsis recta cf, Strain CCMP1620" /LENGTH=124 /DNA_ID=CAMNT_0006987457 /DNA_START=192 /DNA_END=566 /DNA_ORIENTATION=+
MVQNKPDVVEKAIDRLKPIFKKLSFGAIMGYSSGYATKKIGKVAAFAVGLGFITLQSIAMAGWIEIDWMKIKDDAFAKVDTDGDGKLTTSDVKVYWRKFRTLLTNKLPDGAGFSLGFLMGVRHG